MKQPSIIKYVASRFMIASLFLLSLLVLGSRPVLAQEPDPTDCLMTQNCTANDFGDIIVSNVVVHTTGCDINNQVELSFDLTFTSASSTRYDIGLILAQDGFDAMRDDYLNGQCYRDYLAAPLINTNTASLWPTACTQDTVDGTCFWNAELRDPADLCGDLGSLDQALIHVVRQKVECVDTDADGKIDLSICQIYDNNSADTCASVTDATTGTVAKCDCQRINIPVSPTAITLTGLEARSTQNYLLGGLGLLLVMGMIGSYWLYRRQRS